VVYTSEQENKQREYFEHQITDQALYSAARKIYQTYCYLHKKLNRDPIGVAINPKTYRGQLVFTKKPILLPGERFVPLNQLESEYY